jgi:tetratricopeptide (TPR) repeat protein
MLLLRARGYGEAIDEARMALELDPSHVNALWWRGLAYAENRDFPRAVAALQKGFATSKAPGLLGSLGYAHARAGERERALGVVRDLHALRAGNRYVCPANLALVYGGLDDADAAFRWLNQACEARDGRVHQLVWPQFDRFRQDSRYLDLKRRIGLG